MMKRLMPATLLFLAAVLAAGTSRAANADFDGGAPGAAELGALTLPMKQEAARLRRPRASDDERSMTLTVNVYDGRRELLPAGPVFITVFDGAQRLIAWNYFEGPSVPIRGIPYYDDGTNVYRVIVWAKGYRESGFMPVRIAPGGSASVDVMLLPKHPRFDFSRASCADLSAQVPGIWALLSAGAPGEEAACARWEKTMGRQPETAACLLNITTALSGMYIEERTVLSYFKRILWQSVLAPAPARDRFFAAADGGLLEELRTDPELRRTYAPEAWPNFFHPGAIYSWKQITFDQANVQLTVHPYDGKAFSSDKSVPIIVEPDIDYYKDALAHLFLEVIPNAITQTLTDPRCTLD